MNFLSAPFSSFLFFFSSCIHISHCRVCARRQHAALAPLALVSERDRAAVGPQVSGLSTRRGRQARGAGAVRRRGAPVCRDAPTAARRQGGTRGRRQPDERHSPRLDPASGWQHFRAPAPGGSRQVRRLVNGCRDRRSGEIPKRREVETCSVIAIRIWLLLLFICSSFCFRY